MNTPSSRDAIALALAFALCSSAACLSATGELLGPPPADADAGAVATRSDAAATEDDAGQTVTVRDAAAREDDASTPIAEETLRFVLPPERVVHAGEPFPSIVVERVGRDGARKLDADDAVEASVWSGERALAGTTMLELQRGAIDFDQLSYPEKGIIQLVFRSEGAGELISDPIYVLGRIEIERVGSSGEPTYLASTPSLSSDGKKLTFHSQGEGWRLVDRELGTDVLLEFSHPGVPANGASSTVWLTGDGRSVTFNSGATNYFSPDRNHAQPDALVLDLSTMQTELAGLAADGSQFAGGATAGIRAASDDGQQVAFIADAPSVPDSAIFFDGIYVRDRARGTTTFVTPTNVRQPGLGPQTASLSGDGRFLVFDGTFPDITPGDTDGERDVFIADLLSGSIEHASVETPDGLGAYGASCCASMSRDARFVLYHHDGRLFPGVASYDNLALYDRTTGALEQVNIPPESSRAAPAPIAGLRGSMSEDARFIAFIGASVDENGGDDDPYDVYLRDRRLGVTVRLNTGLRGGEADGRSGAVVISADGSTIAFISEATDLVPGDDNGRTDVFVISNPFPR